MRLYPLQAFWGHFWRARPLSSEAPLFLRRLYAEVLRDRRAIAEADAIERLRRELSDQRTQIAVVDHGAGSDNRGGGWKQVSLGRIARRAACSRTKGEHLLRLTRFFQPKRMLELGTHLGFSALYQLTGAPQARLVTLEGAGSLAYLAKQHLEQFGFEADIRLGTFDASLAALDLAAYQPDYVYLDGDHRYEPTMRYFHLIAPHASDGAAMVLDDIYWSADMTRAWQAIIAHPEVTFSLDLYHLGLCFLRRHEPKRHWIVR
jgi:predicted O-methyltransferase YrrM